VSRSKSAWSALGGEALAIARQAWLLSRDLQPSHREGEKARAVPSVPPSQETVVLIHGLFATAGVLRPLRHAVERRGHATTTLTYAPGPGVAELSSRLASLVSSLPSGARLHLVGHSLGGLVCRHYAQLVGDVRVVQTISLASPFAGMKHASRLLFDGARDLEADSPLLRALRLGASEHPTPHLSVVAEHDHLVRPPLAHALPGGEVRIVPGLGHNAMLFAPEVGRIVADRVDQAAAPASLRAQAHPSKAPWR
jgi:triacylglycerol lipase